MKPIVLFDIPMCMAHRGLWSLLQELTPKPTCALFVNRRHTGAKLVLNHEVILHIRTATPMDAETMIRLLEVAGKLDESIKRKLRLKLAKTRAKKAA